MKGKQLFEANTTSHSPAKEKGSRGGREQISLGDLNRDRDERDRRQNTKGRSARQVLDEGEFYVNGDLRSNNDRRGHRDMDRDKGRGLERSKRRESSRREGRKESIIDKKRVVVPAKGFQLLTRPTAPDVDACDNGTKSPPSSPPAKPLTKTISTDDVTIQTTSTDSNAAVVIGSGRLIYRPSCTNPTQPNGNFICVTNLRPSATKSDIFKTFADYGKLGKIHIDDRGCGSIEFISPHALKRVLDAYEADKSTFVIQGRVVHVTEKPDSVFAGFVTRNDYDTNDGK